MDSSGGTITMKKLICILVALLLLLGSLPASAAWAATIVDSGTCGDDLIWSLDSDGLLTISGNGAITSNTWNKYSQDIKTIVVGEGITRIPESAFSGCSNLESVTLPFVGRDMETEYGRETVFGYVFGGDYYVDQYYQIDAGSGTFYGYSIPSSLKEVTITGGELKYGAFSSCGNIEKINIGCNVNRIASFKDDRTSFGGAFSGCDNLVYINIDSGNQYYTSIDGIVFNKDVTEILWVPTAISGEYVIPGSVTRIGDAVFSRCFNLNSVVMPERLIAIGEGSFSLCTQLQNVDIPSSVTSIGESAFDNCLLFTHIILPSGLNHIEAATFEHCKALKSITIPDQVDCIGRYAFNGCTDLFEIFYDGTGAQWNAIEVLDYNMPLLNAARHYSGDNLTWTIDSDGLLTISGTGAMDEYSFPSDVPWHNIGSSIKSVVIEDGVTSIGRYAFYYCRNLTNITIPDSVKSIGDYAFFCCHNMNEVTIPGSVKSIGHSAFGCCISLRMASIPGSVISIGDDAFCNCDTMVTVVIESGVKEIGEGAFLHCPSLTSITVPDSMISIADSAFRYCPCLTDINIDSANEYFSAEGGMLFDKSKQKLICCTQAVNGSYSVPAGVTEIGSFAFIDCSGLTSVSIPPSVTSIGDSAFYGCSGLTSVSLSCSVTSIGEYAFYECSSLTEIIIPEGMMSIEEGTFAECTSLTNVTIPNSVTYIGDGSFSGCKSLTDVHYGGTLDQWSKISIGSENDCLNKATLDYLTVIDSGNCGDHLTWILYSNGLLTISGSGEMDDYLYFKVDDSGPIWSDGNKTLPWLDQSENIKTVKINPGVTRIGNGAFDSCENLTSITIPDSVTRIGDGAFCGCSSITEITIPNSVISLGGGTFADCVSLISLAIPNSITTIAADTFALCRSLTNITIPSSVTSIGQSAFYNCDSLTHIDIPNNVTSIGKWAFEGCDSLVSVTIGTGAASIGPRAFLACSNLESIVVDSYNNCFSSSQDGVLFDKGQTTLICCPGGKEGYYNIPDTVAVISDSAFSGCNSLTNINIPESVTSIEDYAFLVCHSLTSISVASDNAVFSSVDGVLFSKDKTKLISFPGGRIGYYSIPDGVTSIEKWAFYSCDGLTGVTIPDSVITVDVEAFCICYNLVYVSIGNGVNTIEDRAFMFCNSLTEVTISGSVTGIGCDAFAGNNTLTDIYFIGTPAEWNSIIIADGNDDLLNADLHFLKVFKDNGVKVSIAQGVLGSGVEFRADKLKDDALPEGTPERALVYDFYFVQAGQRVQPNGNVIVSLPVPEGMDGEKCKVYYIDEEGQLTDMHAVFSEGFLVFTTTHFSYYAVVEEKGYVVTLEDYSKGVATIIGIEPGGSYSGDTSFTVSCDEACAVLCSIDGEDYTRLTGREGDNGYSFTVDVTQDMTIIVALKGDVNLDGVLKNQDVTMAKAANLGKRTLSTLQEMVADVTGDGVFKNQDITKFKAALLGKTTLSWDM